jgi:hypothetical protein
MKGAILYLCVSVFICGFIGGCLGRRKPPPPGYYSGPTQTMAEVVAAINENNRKLPTLWMRHNLRAVIIDPEKRGDRGTKVSGDGHIMYRSPQELLFKASAPGVNLFEVGCNPNEYWLAIPYERIDAMWWGRFKHLGKPCAKPIPIRPDLILEVLGVFQINPDFTQPPVPTMRFVNEADAYVLTWIKRSQEDDRFVAVKEVWYDRRTKQPRRVLLYDENGRVLLRAELSNFDRVDIEDVPREQWPQVATTYALVFPDTGTTMDIEIESAMLRRKNFPNDATFRRPTNPGVKKIEQLDADCGP